MKAIATILTLLGLLLAAGCANGVDTRTDQFGKRDQERWDVKP